MKRRKRGKQTLKRKMLSILLLCAMSCILAVVIVSYMTIRMIQNDSIQESMQIYLEQITREIDSDYYDMIGIVNQMSPNGLIGSVTESYLSAEDNYNRYFEQKSLREELIKLGYVNTKLLGIAYYDPKEQKELIGNFNVRVLDPSYQTISKVVVGAENIIQAMHTSYLGIRETPVLSVMRRVPFGNKRVLDIYAEIEPDMSVSDRLNKEKWPYTYMEMDENGIVQYSNNPVIVKGQKLLSELPEKEGYAAINQEGYKIMAYRSSIGYVNAIALPENTYQKEMNMWRLKLVVIILAAFGIFSSSVFYLYRLVCKPLNQFQKQMIQVGNGSLQEAEQEYEIKEFDDLMHEVEQMKEQIRNLIDDVVEKEKSIQRTEYEKLLYQINPHFLLNTLNSVQWMARMSRQDNITEFVQRLKRLLSYNLGKEGMQTTLRTEIDIVKDYIALEQMRYDFVIEMNVEEGRYLEQPTVRMLLQPLVENAIRYGLGDDEKITIQVFEDNIRGLAIITILDSGNGLTQEEINQINEPFDYGVKKMQHGNRGIGLRYEMKVLVVDDDKLARKGLISIMDWGKYGFEVVGDVQNGRKALEFLKDNVVDIVFTDIDMPEIDGIELMKRCKKEYPDVKFVVFSMYEDFRYAQSALRLGALDYISKISFDGDECDQILELVERKYKENQSKKEPRKEDSGLQKRLEKAWTNTRWIFNDCEFNRLCEITRGVELRTAERVFIKSFHSFQKLTGEELEFPSLSSVDEMLEWVKNWKENLYQTCLQTDKTKDIYMFARVILYTDEHIEENLKSEEVATQIGMSRSYFSTRFKEITGDTFHNYVISRKMQAAARKMAKGTENITQIASDLGYDNFYYFTKVFSKEYGCTPTEYAGRLKKCSI